LDSSFLIALERETRMRREGPAFAMLPRLAGRKLCVSIVTVAEFLEGARDRDEAARALGRFTVQPLAWAQARRCAVIQARAERRLGENDAWIVAKAEILGAEVVGRDRGAFARLGERYLRF
jgi:predicted nucleic acid-binding protein